MSFELVGELSIRIEYIVHDGRVYAVNLMTGEVSESDLNPDKWMSRNRGKYAPKTGEPATGAAALLAEHLERTQQ